MDGDRVRKILVRSVFWGLTLALCFGLGTQTARSDLPNCIICPCKNITFWQDLNVWRLGAFQLNNAPTTDVTAVPSINTSGNCAPAPVSNNGTMDIWQIPWSNPICANPGVGCLELTVTQEQLGTVPGTQQPGVNRLKCKGPNAGGN